MLIENGLQILRKHRRGGAGQDDFLPGRWRHAIIAEDAKRGMTVFLPPAVPFGSKQWPSLITPGPGPASLADLH